MSTYKIHKEGNSSYVQRIQSNYDNEFYHLHSKLYFLPFLSRPSQNKTFKAECPEGVVHENSFKDIYAKFFPHGSKLFYYFSWTCAFYVLGAAVEMCKIIFYGCFQKYF